MLGMAIDIETGGLLAGKHEILSVCMILHDEDFCEINRFVSLVKPMHPALITSEALLKNGLKPEVFMKAPTPMEVRHAILNWLEDVGCNEKIIPMGHNYSFDQSFLKIFLQDFYDSIFHYEYRDTKIFLRGLIDSGKIDLKHTSLSYACDFFEIPHVAHDAFGDTWSTLQLYKEMVKICK